MALKSFNMPKMPSVQIRMFKMLLHTSSKIATPELKVLSPVIINLVINPSIQRAQIILLHHINHSTHFDLNPAKFSCGIALSKSTTHTITSANLILL